MKHAVFETNFPDLNLLKKGKVRDIYDLDESMLEIDNPYGFRSEGELAFFEDRKIEDNRLFPDRLKEFFPKYAPLKYMFTGLFIHELIWKPTKKKHTGFHISLC